MSFIIEMIAEGEHQQQDFKMRIEDTRKIARTLVAFANTDGGRLLIGVKDNGTVCGVVPEEEFYMIQAAAEMHCKPPISFKTQVWKSNYQSVLEVQIEKSLRAPHFAANEDGTWAAYQRQEDRNIQANGVLLKVWQYQSTEQTPDFEYTHPIRKLFQALRNGEQLGFRSASRILRLSREKTENILAQLVVWDIVKMDFTDTGCFYSMKDSNKMQAIEDSPIDTTRRMI
ncbi:MAG: ATP-binding protein [Flavobacteriales bacterium]|jgi:hypothetical protein|nr:ATP-binding protein [Flavobacteriales bacterium]